MKRIYLSFRFWGHPKFMCFALSLCVCFFVQTTCAQILRNTLTGFVFDQQRKPVSNIPVELANELGQVLQRIRTDGSGRFFFRGLSSGRFSVRIVPVGTNFEEQSGEIEIVNISRPGSANSENAQKDFYLRVRRNGSESKSVTGTLFAQDVPDEAKKAYEKGISEFEGNRAETGMAALLDAVKIYPDYYLALERLGREYVKQEKYDYARAAFMKTVSVNQRSFSGWYGLGYAAYALKNPETAVPATRKAVELEPSSIDAFLLLGICERQAKRYPDAEKSLLRAKKLSDGSKADVHWNLALLYAKNMNRYKEAADELELYLKASPNDSKAETIQKLIVQFREKAAGVK